MGFHPPSSRRTAGRHSSLRRPGRRRNSPMAASSSWRPRTPRTSASPETRHRPAPRPGPTAGDRGMRLLRVYNVIIPSPSRSLARSKASCTSPRGRFEVDEPLDIDRPVGQQVDGRGIGVRVAVGARHVEFAVDEGPGRPVGRPPRRRGRPAPQWRARRATSTVDAMADFAPEASTTTSAPSPECSWTAAGRSVSVGSTARSAPRSRASSRFSRPGRRRRRPRHRRRGRLPA